MNIDIVNRARSSGRLGHPLLWLGVALTVAGCGSATSGEEARDDVSSVEQAVESCIEIDTLDELRNMQPGQSYCLMANIDATDTDATPFVPIGSPWAPFMGTFEGNHHTIRNLNIAPAPFAAPYTGLYTGLFGATYGATIRNVGLTNVKVKGKSMTGAIAGLFQNSTLSDSYVTGTVTAQSDADGVGMVLGRVNGASRVDRSSATGKLNGAGRTIGGFAGQVDAAYSSQVAMIFEVFTNVAVSSSKTTGTVYAGGFAGKLSGALLEEANVVGNVTGRNYVGGIAGYVAFAPNQTWPSFVRRTLYRGNVTDRASAVDRAGPFGGDAPGALPFCSPNLWDTTVDPGAPVSLVSNTEDRCQEGHPTSVLTAPHPDPNKLIWPFYVGAFLTPETLVELNQDPCGLWSGSDGDFGFGTCGVVQTWALNSPDQHISLLRIPNPGAQPLDPGIGNCTAANAIDLGAVNTIKNVASNACLKVTNYPSGNWMNNLVLQGVSGAFPLDFTWLNCDTMSDDALPSAGVQRSLPIDRSCNVLIKLRGSSSSNTTLTWWGNG